MELGSDDFLGNSFYAEVLGGFALGFFGFWIPGMFPISISSKPNCSSGMSLDFAF